MDLQLTNKTALVSGSNRGTGEIIARTLAREGASVLVHGAEETAAKAVASSIGGATAVWGDITCDQGAKQVIQQVNEQAGNIDILVNNYGTGSMGSWSKTGSEDWIDMYQKNVLSVARLVQGFVEGMKTSQWGRVINLGTIGSHQPNSIMPHYYASKGALATLGVSLTKELAGTGITVNTVSPGIIHTEEVEQMFRQRAKKENWGEDWETIVRKMVASDYPNPSGRIASRQEVADLVVFLCSPLAAYINGQNIRVDGGAVSYV